MTRAGGAGSGRPPRVLIESALLAPALTGLLGYALMSLFNLVIAAWRAAGGEVPFETYSEDGLGASLLSLTIVPGAATLFGALPCVPILAIGYWLTPFHANGG